MAMLKIASRYSSFILACLAILAVFTVDSMTPLGIEIWVFYLPIILSMVFSNSARLIAIMAAACSVFVVAGRYLSPPGLNPDWWDAVNRGMGLMAIWLTASAGVAICIRSKQLAKLYQELFVEAESRKQTEQLLRESEERMRLAMESGGLGTRDVNLQNNREIWSETHFRICGYEPISSGVADSDMLDRLIHSDDLKRILMARQQAREERSLYHVEFRLRRADTQKIIWIELWGRYYYDQKGEAVRLVGICFDISRRKELERKELEREILEITTTQQQIIGQDLHDGLGQELTGLGLMAQTLAQQLPEDSMGNRIVTRLIVGIDHTHRLVRDLSRGLIAIEVDARGLGPALRELAKWTIENTGISVIVECPESFELPDQTTATHVFRIVQEAVSNALRHGLPRQIRITVIPESSGPRFDIKDDGIGLHDKAEAKQGLGLRIMKYRAGLIGGVLQIDSEEEGGTMVTLTLPRRNSDDFNPTES
jgi:PAS domain S-box-containing protein